MSKKIYVAFISLAVMLIALMSFGIFRFVYTTSIKNNEEQVKEVVANITEYTSVAVDRDSLQFLISHLDPKITEEQIEAIEATPQYNKVLYQLRMIQTHFSKYCSFIYIIYPINDSVYFVIGADSPAIKSVDKYSVAFDASAFPYMEKALKYKISTIEPKINYDPQYKNYSISSYAPIITESNGFLGVVGLDLEKSDYGKLLTNYALASGLVSVVGLLCVFFTIFTILEKTQKHLYKRN